MVKKIVDCLTRQICITGNYETTFNHFLSCDSATILKNHKSAFILVKHMCIIQKAIFIMHFRLEVYQPIEF